MLSARRARSAALADACGWTVREWRWAHLLQTVHNLSLTRDSDRQLNNSGDEKARHITHRSMSCGRSSRTIIRYIHTAHTWTDKDDAQAICVRTYVVDGAKVGTKRILVLCLLCSSSSSLLLSHSYIQRTHTTYTHTLSLLTLTTTITTTITTTLTLTHIQLTQLTRSLIHSYTLTYTPSPSNVPAFFSRQHQFLLTLFFLFLFLHYVLMIYIAS